MKISRMAGAMALALVPLVSAAQAQQAAHANELEEVVVTASPIAAA
jgi:hypothetical protein